MIEQLLAYQEADKKLKEIEKMLSESPERKKAVNAKKYIDGVEENLTKLDVKAKELSIAFESAISEQIKLKEQESEINNSLEELEDEKGAEFLIKKADELYSKIKDLENKITKISTEIQSLTKEYENIRLTTKKAQAQYNENAPKYKALRESFNEQINSVKKELATLSNKVDKQLLEKYLSKRSGKMFPIVGAIRGEHCGLCNMEQPTSLLNKIRKGEIIECCECGAILYQK